MTTHAHPSGSRLTLSGATIDPHKVVAALHHVTDHIDITLDIPVDTTPALKDALEALAPIIIAAGSVVMLDAVGGTAVPDTFEPLVMTYPCRVCSAPVQAAADVPQDEGAYVRIVSSGRRDYYCGACT